MLTERYHDAPLKLAKTFREDATGALMVYLMDVSPGLMDGDRYDLDIRLEDRAHLILTNPSFTKVHPTPYAGAETDCKFTVASGAVLEYFPEPTIPYAGSRLEARTRFDLSDGAILLYADIVTPGRTHRGETFQYDSLLNQMEVYRCEKLIAWDRFLLTPSIHDYRAIGAMEHYTHSGAFWIFSDCADEKLLERIRLLLPSDPSAELLAAASMTAEQGIAVRMLGLHVWRLQALVDAIWAECRSYLWGYPRCKLRK